MSAFDATTVAAPREAPAPAAPVTGWHRALRDWGVVSGAAGVCHAVGAVTSLLLRALLMRAQMGIWQAMKLLLSYGNYANLGISKGAARELTVARGRGDASAAEHGLNLAFTVNTLTSLVYAALLVGAGLWVGWSSGGVWSGAWAAGLIVVGGLAVVGRYLTFHVTILRSQQSFATTSKLSLLEAALTLIVCGVATWRWGLAGLYGGTLVVMLASLGFVWPRRGATLRWAWDGPEIGRLIAVGGPILLAGTVSSLFRSLDKLMILGYLSDREFQLGCYSLALMVTAQLYGLGNMLSVVMGPRYGEKYGRSGDRGEVARLAARATELQAAAVALPAGLAVVAAPPLLAWLLPDYVTGLPPLVWLVPGVIALCVALPATQYLVAVGRQGRALGAAVAATALAAVGNHVALRGGYGLRGVAAATAASYMVYFVLSVGISIWNELDRADRARYLAALVLALAPTVGLALLLERLQPGIDAGWATTAWKAVAVTLAWGLTAAVGWHRGGWRLRVSDKGAAGGP
ncbi:MAG: lipopolysaccharide biosynthesis protein [Planctomycetota bacterium]|jgi:O-antigen/teichoic acid export membrane protein